MAINEVVVPAVLRRIGLSFDYNTLRRLWLMGKEFQVSWATPASKPRWSAHLRSASLIISNDGRQIADVRFENGVTRIADGFLDRLYETYTFMQEWDLGTVVTAWEMRAAFCFHNRCAPGVFDYLFNENYGGSETYRIDKDFPPRSKPSHEDPLVVGGREIGLIRISKRCEVFNFFVIRSTGRFHPALYDIALSSFGLTRFWDGQPFSGPTRGRAFEAAFYSLCESRGMRLTERAGSRTF